MHHQPPAKRNSKTHSNISLILETIPCPSTRSLSVSTIRASARRSVSANLDSHSCILSRASLSCRRSRAISDSLRRRSIDPDSNPEPNSDWRADDEYEAAGKRIGRERPAKVAGGGWIFGERTFRERRPASLRRRPRHYFSPPIRSSISSRRPEPKGC